MSVCFFKQKTAYEMRISDWSSYVCSSDLAQAGGRARTVRGFHPSWAQGRRLPTHLAGRFRYRTAAPGLQGSAATGRPHPLHGHALGRTAGAQSPAGRSAGTGDRGAEMKPPYQPLFPDDLSDEAAVALSAFLSTLAVAFESRYTIQQIGRAHV